MSAIPDNDAYDDDPWEHWDDEWSREEWAELSVVDRGERNSADWLHWVGQLALVALILPITLGLLVAALIWIF